MSLGTENCEKIRNEISSQRFLIGAAALAQLTLQLLPAQELCHSNNFIGNFHILRYCRYGKDDNKEEEWVSDHQFILFLTILSVIVAQLSEG